MIGVFVGFAGCISSGYASTIGTLRGSSLVDGLDWGALLIWDLSWFTSLSLSWTTYLTGTFGVTTGGLDFLDISARVLNASLCPFTSFTSGISDAGFCLS